MASHSLKENAGNEPNILKRKNGLNSHNIVYATASQNQHWLILPHLRLIQNSGPWADGQILSPIPNFCFHGVAKISSTEPRRAELDGDNQVFEWLWFYELTTSFKQSRMSSKDLWHTGAKNQGRVPVPGPKLSKTFE